MVSCSPVTVNVATLFVELIVSTPLTPVAVTVVAAKAVKFIVSIPAREVGTTVPTAMNEAFNTSAPANPLALSPVCNVATWVPNVVVSNGALKVSLPVVPVRLS
ncbi:MAG: hypothetical protein AAB341_05900 [Planctomycetota bacterium]